MVFCNSLLNANIAPYGWFYMKFAFDIKCIHIILYDQKYTASLHIMYGCIREYVHVREYTSLWQNFKNVGTGTAFT